MCVCTCPYVRVRGGRVWNADGGRVMVSVNDLSPA